ncbi:MAG: hypothetical protein MUC50_21310 [Myxococcota bacterium]|jgi:hypothetical protein|nr:hypothetical protein [Myxococcota bacterium]
MSFPSPLRFLTGVLSCAVVAACLGCDQWVDKGDDKLIAGRQSVEVVYKGNAQTVLFDNLETIYPVDDESPAVALDAVVLGSGLVTSLEGLYLNYVGADGFHPIGVCSPEYAPTPAELAVKGFIERGTTRLIWDESAGFEKCMFVRDVVTIEIADDPEDLPLNDDGAGPDTDFEPTEDGVPFESVDIHYNGETATLDPRSLPTSILYDETVVLVSELLEASSFDIELSTVTLDFEGSDGYRPGAKGTCSEHLPAPGERASQAGISLETSELLWEPQLAMDKCAAIKLMAHIWVEPVEQ